MLVKFEAYIESNDELISEECFENMKSLSGCKKELEKEIERIFEFRGNLSFLIPVFKKALNFKPDERYKTLEEFSSDILLEFSKIEGAKKSVEMEIDFGLKNFPKRSSSYFWKCKALSENFSTSVFRIMSKDSIKNETLKKLCDAKKNMVVAANPNIKQQI